MCRDWLAGGPQKAYADFNLRTHGYTLGQTRIMGGAKALFKKDDKVQAYRIRSEEKGWVMSAGKQKVNFFYHKY
jgi:hypothetical protein